MLMRSEGRDFTDAIQANRVLFYSTLAFTVMGLKKGHPGAGTQKTVSTKMFEKLSK